MTTRQNRVLPLIVVPWEEGHAICERAVVALTKDVSDHGIGIVVNEPFDAEDLDVIVGLWSPEEDMPWFFRGSVRRKDPIGGGYEVLGIELTETVDLRETEELEDLLSQIQDLLPPIATEAVGE